MTTHGAVRRLNAAVAPAGGVARFFSDNGFVAGLAHDVWPAIERFDADLAALLELVPDDSIGLLVHEDGDAPPAGAGRSGSEEDGTCAPTTELADAPLLAGWLRGELIDDGAT